MAGRGAFPQGRLIAPLGGDAPDGVADVIRDQKRSSRIDGDADRTSISDALLIGRHESGDEIFRRAVWPSVVESNKNHLVAGVRPPIPGTVFADEGAAAKMLRKRIAGIEGQA